MVRRLEELGRSSSKEADMTILTPDQQRQTPSPPRQRRPRLLIVALVLVVLVGAGVTGAVLARNHKNATVVAGSGVPKDGTATSAAPQSDEQQITTAYKGYWSTLDVANTPPVNAKPPGLEHYATGPQLASAQDALQKKITDGVAIRRPSPTQSQHQVSVVSISGDRAQVRDCDIDDSVIIRADTGAATGPNGVATLQISGTMVREGSIWKVWSLTLEKTTQGIVSCAATS